MLLTVLGYMLLGSVISPNSILPTPGLDCSTSPGGQTCLSHALSGSHAPLASCSVTGTVTRTNSGLNLPIPSEGQQCRANEDG